MTPPPAASQPSDGAPSGASQALRAGRSHDLAGRLAEAAEAYAQAVELAGSSKEGPLRVEALRRLGVVSHRFGDLERAQELCSRSYAEAIELGDLSLAGEALNALAGFALEAGAMAESRSNYVSALALSGGSPSLLGRIEQNLGILDSVQGNHDSAFAHFRRALEAFRQAEDDHGCAIAHHNLGLIASRRGELDQADHSFSRSASLAAQVGDTYLASLCELHRAEVSHGRQRYGDALQRSENALGNFERLGDRRAMSDAYKVIGKVLRESGRTALAEERLKTAQRLAEESGWVLGEAEAVSELARLQEYHGRKHEALALLRVAQELYTRLEARRDLWEISQRITELAA